MKKRASSILKNMLSLLASVAKTKTIAVKNKTCAFKARLIVFSLLKLKNLQLSSISNKIHTILGQAQAEADTLEYDQQTEKDEDMDNLNVISEPGPSFVTKFEDDSDKYPDLTHSLFDEEDDDDDFDDNGESSVIELVKNSKEGQEEFTLEDEIDEVASLFIRRFHKQMRLQKLESFKRYQEMLARSV
ncbi:Protein of unknown function DUF761, plant [Dillenia turbinata]|uniref:Uncharacterized protein n=1 Tax=Dillenia turbinata TaxID=194707 RepID=A0AAN8ZRY6_9MAGN